MQGFKMKVKGMLSMMLAVMLLFGTTGTAWAHAEGEEDDGVHDETPYEIAVYNEHEVNQNGNLTYTVTCHEHGEVSEVYDLEDKGITAVEGDVITLYPAAKDGYVLGSIGYVKADRAGQAFNIKSVKAQEDGSYTFTMPAYPIYVGAAFYGSDEYYVVNETGTSNSVANVDPLHVLDLGLNHAWVNEDTEEISVDIHLDTRILEFEALTGKELTFTIEVRQVGDRGFSVYGSKDYTTEELKALVDEKSYGVETDSKGREYYVLRNVVTPVDVDKDFIYTEDNSYEIYCTAMYTLDGWVNAVGAPNYRWGYSGGDRAYILKKDTPIPTSMVYLYNLEPETYHGALVAEAIDRVEEEMGITIETRYFNRENMGESLGYLAEWPGYESRGEDVSSDKVFKKKIVLYCSLPSMVRDRLGDYVRETGAGATSSKLTVYGAGKSFEELYKNLETESEVFTAALSLSLLTYEAYLAVPEAEYGTHELWPEFKAAYDECKTIINMTAEQEISVYKNARLKLLDVYLRILSKIALDVDFEFVIESYDEEHYKITVDTSDFPQDFYPEYYWYDSSSLDHLIIPKDELYKVRCTISAPDDSVYYGFKGIRLYAPDELSYEISSDNDRITATFTKYEAKANMPEPITYVAELYKGDELIETRSNTTAETIAFENLERGTQYTVRVYATNLVGRTTYQSETVELMPSAILELIKQPVDASAQKGQKASVSVEASGEGLTYTWYYKNPGNVKFYKSGTTYLSEDRTTYSIPMYAWRDGQQVYCVITDANGETLQTNTVTLTMVKGSIEIVEQPKSVKAAKGETASVTVKAEGENLTYTWYYKNPGNKKFYKSGSSYISEDGTTYSITMNQWRNGQEIYCVISNAAGESVQTNTVTLCMTK